MRYSTFACITIASIAVVANAIVAAGSIHACSVLVAVVITGRAFVQIGAVKFVDPIVTRKTLARIRTLHVDAHRVCVAVVTV